MLSSILNILPELTGKLDLTPDDWAWWINTACHTLDQEVDTGESETRLISRLTTGEDTVSVSDLRSIRNVYLVSDDDQRIECNLGLNTMPQFRAGLDPLSTQTLIQQMLGLTTAYSSVAGDQIYCVRTKSRSVQGFVDTTVVARADLANAAAVVLGNPLTATTLVLKIEDGLLYPLNPARDITQGTIIVAGTDIDGAVLRETVDCSAGEGTYVTVGRFKTVTAVLCGDYLGIPVAVGETPVAFDHIGVAGNTKLTVATGRRAFLKDLTAGSTWRQQTLTFYPTLTENLTVEVYGRFWSKTLVLDTDENFWTEEAEDVLLWRIMQLLEVPMRNSEGYRDYEVEIQRRLRQIEIERVQRWEDTSSNTMVG